MKITKTVLITRSIVGISLAVFHTYANAWNIPNNTIIPRTQRGAVESRRIREGGSSDIQETGYESSEENDEHDHITKQPILPTPTNPYKIAEEFLEKNYPEDIAIDQIIKEENGSTLIWPFQYRSTKKAIIIHHTASNQEKIKKDGILKHLQNIYQFHTKTRGRGDIGYHFLIDDKGKIYEGKAGGENIIGAHTKRNNPNTIGIALIGNFDEQDPTKEQLDSLIKLTAGIADKYNINPDQTVTFHQWSDQHPYLIQHKHPSIIGHQDAGNTSCPGSALYEKLDFIRAEVKKQLLTNKIEGDIASIHYMNTHHQAKKEQTQITLPFEYQSVRECELVDSQAWTITQCKKTDDGLQISIKQNWKPTYGNKLITATNENNQKVVYYTNIVRQEDIDNLMAYRQRKLHKDQRKNESNIQKIQEKIAISQIAKIWKEKVSVLLYDASTLQTLRTFNCSGYCTRETPNDIYSGNSVTVNVYDETTLAIKTNTGQEPLLAPSIKIQSSQSGGTIQITNFERKSYANIPWNIFKGEISIKQEPIINIENKQEEKRFVLTNKLEPLDYMLGIAESNDQEPREKTKTLAILAKQYLLYYLNGKNTHPSIPQEASYQAIDDPRSFQKYVGAGFEETSKSRKDAVLQTQNIFITYEGFIPILPYFSCSRGLTQSAQQQRGRNDTPYLQSVIDFQKASCDEKQGHGVGLSGKGASYMANNGLDYKTILKYYYQGIQIQQVFF